MGDFSIKAILSAVDKNFSSTMKSALGYTNNLKSTLTSGIGFGAMMAVGQNAVNVVSNKMSSLSKETIETSDSMYKLQAAMRFSGYAEDEIQRIAGATGSLKTYADKTVFSLQDVMSTFGALSANGIKDADKLTEAVGNAVAVFGGGAQEYSSVALAFSQAMAAGALHAQDWNQILNASPQLAGGLRKELIRLNPVLGEDFKGAMEDGAITADLLAEAMNNIGMTDMAKEAATSVTTFEGAMGNLEATAVSGMMKLYDTFAKSSVIDAINSLNGKIEAGFDWLATAIPVAIDKISPYWEVFKSNVVEVKDAFGDAVSAIAGSLEELTGAFGSTESVNSFSDILGTVTDALTTFAGFLSEHSDTIAKVITLLPKLYVAYKGFQIVKAVAPFVGAFTGAIGGLAKAGLGKLAQNLFNVSKGQEAVGKSSGGSSKQMMQSALSFLALGAGIALICAGFALLSYSAIQLAEAGPLAAGVMLGMVVAIGALLLVAKSVAPALSAGAVGFIAFGAAIVLAAAGMMLMTNAAISLSNAGPVAIACMVGMVAAIVLLAVGAAALGPALTAGAVGLIAFSLSVFIVSAALALLITAVSEAAPAIIGIMQQFGDTVTQIMTGVGDVITSVGDAISGILDSLAGVFDSIGMSALNAGMGFKQLASGVKTLTNLNLIDMGASMAAVASGIGAITAVSGGLSSAGEGMKNLGTGLMMISSSSTMAVSGLTGIAAAITPLATVLPALVPVLSSASVAVVSFASGTVIAFASLSGASGSLLLLITSVNLLNASLKSVNASTAGFANAMRSVSGSAGSTGAAVQKLQTSIQMLGPAFSNAGNQGKSALKQLMAVMNATASAAVSAGQKTGNGFASGVSAGGVKAVSAARSMSNSVVASMRAASSGAYSCGVYIGQGLANGMSSMLGTVRSVAAQLAAAADAAIQAKAKIGSPSKVQDKNGRWWGQGFANGILAKVQTVKKAADKLMYIPELNQPELSFAGAYGSSGTLNADYEYTSNATYTFNIVAEAEGRQIAKASATYTKEELNRMDKMNNYLKGVRK